MGRPSSKRLLEEAAASQGQRRLVPLLSCESGTEYTQRTKRVYETSEKEVQCSIPPSWADLTAEQTTKQDAEVGTDAVLHELLHEYIRAKRMI